MKLPKNFFQGILFGSGALQFALVVYVFHNARKSRGGGYTVDLSPYLLAGIFGVKEDDVFEALKSLESGWPELVKLDERAGFSYSVRFGKEVV